MEYVLLFKLEKHIIQKVIGDFEFLSDLYLYVTQMQFCCCKFIQSAITLNKGRK